MEKLYLLVAENNAQNTRNNHSVNNHFKKMNILHEMQGTNDDNFVPLRHILNMIRFLIKMHTLHSINVAYNIIEHIAPKHIYSYNYK